MRKPTISKCAVPHECIDRQRCLYHCQDEVVRVLGEDGEYFWAVVTPDEEESITGRAGCTCPDCDGAGMVEDQEDESGVSACVLCGGMGVVRE